MPVKLCKRKPVSETGCQTNRSSKKLWKANQCCTRFCKKMITKFVGIFSLSWKRSCRTELCWCVRRILTSIGFPPLYGYILLNSSLNCAWFIFFRVLKTARAWNGKICTQMSHRGVNEQCKYVLFLLKARVALDFNHTDLHIKRKVCWNNAKNLFSRVAKSISYPEPTFGQRRREHRLWHNPTKLLRFLVIFTAHVEEEEEEEEDFIYT